MKMHGMEYFKIHRKYSAVTKLKFLDEMCRFVFILFPHIKYEFQIQIKSWYNESFGHLLK